jgi:hypothetical protein
MRSRTPLILALLLGLATSLLPGESALTVLSRVGPRSSRPAMAAPALAQTVLRVEGMRCGT